MNLKDARRLAEDDGSSGQLCAQAAIINHCHERFDEVVEALERAVYRIELIYGDGSNNKIDSILLAELNKTLARAKDVNT